MTPSLALAAFLSLPLPFFGHGPAKPAHPPKAAAPAARYRNSTKKYAVAGWTLVVRKDSFAESTACSLRRGKVEYGRSTLTFHLPAQINTFSAVYRIDGGPPLKAADDMVQMARLGFALHDDDMDNPSGGLVRIPEQRLLKANTVRIEAPPGRRPAPFKVLGLNHALDAARAAGCKPDDFG
jgi:hypothetical protein